MWPINNISLLAIQHTEGFIIIMLPNIQFFQLQRDGPRKIYVWPNNIQSPLEDQDNNKNFRINKEIIIIWLIYETKVTWSGPDLIANYGV